jgi:Protein of unknown function (DUF1622)
MTALGQTLALLCTAGGLVVGLVVVIATREGLVALRIALEFWTAAGLLRLSGAASWRELAAAAAIVGLRQLLNLALGTAPATTAGENLPGPRRG